MIELLLKPMVNFIFLHFGMMNLLEIEHTFSNIKWIYSFQIECKDINQIIDLFYRFIKFTTASMVQLAIRMYCNWPMSMQSNWIKQADNTASTQRGITVNILSMNTWLGRQGPKERLKRSTQKYEFLICWKRNGLRMVVLLFFLHCGEAKLLKTK